MITLYKILKNQPDFEEDEEYVGEFKTSTELAIYFLSKGIDVASSTIRHAIEMYDENGIELLRQGHVIKDTYKVFKILD